MKTHISGVFIVTFGLRLATVGYFNGFYAKQALQRDTEQLLFEFHDALLSTITLLQALPEPDHFQCNNKT